MNYKSKNPNHHGVGQRGALVVVGGRVAQHVAPVLLAHLPEYAFHIIDLVMGWFGLMVRRELLRQGPHDDLRELRPRGALQVRECAIPICILLQSLKNRPELARLVAILNVIRVQFSYEFFFLLTFLLCRSGIGLGFLARGLLGRRLFLLGRRLNGRGL